MAQQTQLTPKQRTEKFMSSVLSRKATFQELLPAGVKADWYMAEIRVAVAKTKGLAECDDVSLFDAIATCAQLGLSPSGRLGSAYLIPFKGKCTLVVGYKGYLELAYRSGEVKGMHAQVVYENDEFDWEEGLSPVLKHKRSEDDNPGQLRAAYAVAEMKDGYKVFVVMLRREVLAIKARSPGARQGGSPWQSDEAEMWKKTAIRRLIKLLPLSPQKAQGLARAQEAEDAVFEEMPDLVQGEDGETAAPTSKMERLNQQLGAGSPPQRIETTADRREPLPMSHPDAEPPEDVVLPGGAR